MKVFLWITCLLICSELAFAQDSFIFLSNKKKVSIPFKLINNLIIIPMKINGVELNFLLDTGVEETILFSLDEKEELQLRNVEKIKLRGLGNEDSVEGLKSTNNSLSLGSIEKKNQEILIVLDEAMNFSSSLGIPVNGIIGYHFFKNDLVRINYSSKKIIVYNRSRNKIENITKGFKSFEMSIERSKPYMGGIVEIDKDTVPVKLLIDTGNSDAVWLFHKKPDKLEVPVKNFEDFLGRGFSGEVYGRKARIKRFLLGQFEFETPLVAFPDTSSIRHVKMVKNRSGSIGGEIFKRFSVVFDYKNSKLYLKKNVDFNEPFHYNMSGIELHHSGLKMIKQADNSENISLRNGIKIDLGAKEYDMKYKFELKPIYEIASIRKDSPAEKAGLKKGDILLSIDRTDSYKYTLQDINEILKSRYGKIINIEVERNNTVLKFRVQLESIL